MAEKVSDLMGTAFEWQHPRAKPDHSYDTRMERDGSSLKLPKQQAPFTSYPDTYKHTYSIYEGTSRCACPRMLTMHPHGNQHICKVTCTHTHIYTGMHTYLDTCVHMSTNAHMHTYMDTWTHTWTHEASAHIFTYIHTCPGTDKHMCTHTRALSLKHTGVCTYQIQIWISGYTLALYECWTCIPTYTLIYAHRPHAHGPSHVHTRACKYPLWLWPFPKAPILYHRPILSWGIIHISDKRMGY